MNPPSSLPLERVDVEADFGLLLGGHGVEAVLTIQQAWLGD